MSQDTQPAIIEIGGQVKIQSPPRADGYRPICDPLWVWARILGFPPLEPYRLMLCAARRLDTGHRQLERVREGIDALAAPGSVLYRRQVHEVIGDAEHGAHLLPDPGRGLPSRRWRRWPRRRACR